MRLDEFDPNAINIEDQRGGGRRLPGGRGGQVGCGTFDHRVDRRLGVWAIVEPLPI